MVTHSVSAAGAHKLQTSVLTNDYANSKAALDVRLAQEQHVSVSIDVWKSNCSQAAYACDVRLTDGTTNLFGAQEVSNSADPAVGASGRAHVTCLAFNKISIACIDSSSCTLQNDVSSCFVRQVQQVCMRLYVASAVLMKWVTMLGPAKVGSVCTDDIAGLAAARSLLPSMPGCTHIVQYRQASERHPVSLMVVSACGRCVTYPRQESACLQGSDTVNRSNTTSASQC